MLKLAVLIASMYSLALTEMQEELVFRSLVSCPAIIVECAPCA